MPANLNALIRYKQIDRDLRNPYVKSTIESLQKSCSNQLAEHRGVYGLISERTIRDDIRVMRSDALGFNAPIVVKKGVYTYDVIDYSIFNEKIDEIELFGDILNILIEEREHIKNPNLNELIKVISNKIGVKDHYENNQICYLNSMPNEENTDIFYEKIIRKTTLNRKIFIKEKQTNLEMLERPIIEEFLWRDILELLN